MLGMFLKLSEIFYSLQNGKKLSLKMPGLAPMLHFEICFWIQNWCSNVSLFLPYTKYTKALLYFPPTKAQNTNKGSKNFVCPTWHDRKESPSKATKNHPIKYKKPFLVDTSHCSFQANECSHVTTLL